MTLHLLVWAQAVPSSIMNLVPFLGVGAVMYFLMIRPQQKQAKEHQTLLTSLKKGDKVVTSGGLLGKVFAVSDKELTLEIAAGVKVQVLKSSVQGKGTVEEPAAIVKAEEK